MKELSKFYHLHHFRWLSKDKLAVSYMYATEDTRVPVCWLIFPHLII